MNRTMTTTMTLTMLSKRMFAEPRLFPAYAMRAALLGLCLTAVSSLPARAQDNPAAPPAPPPPMQPMGGHDRMEGRQMEKLTKRLDLTPDQVTQMKAIHEDTMKQAMAIRDDASIAKADKHGRMMEIHKAAHEKIRALLSDEQKVKFDAMQAEMRGRRMNRREGQGHEGQGVEGQGGAPPTPPPAAAPQQ